MVLEADNTNLSRADMRLINNTKIILLNQSTGKLFQELSEDLSKVWAPSVLYTGHHHIGRNFESGLLIKCAPSYDRSSIPKRLWSWTRYFISSFIFTVRQPKSALIFIVSNPPFLGLIGVFFKLMRKQKYVVLVYDIYPDVLIGLGTISNGILCRFWMMVNRLVLGHASLVFTIGEDMADRLDCSYKLNSTVNGSVISIPNWADVSNIKPIEKHNNSFATEHDQVGKFTVLYSGNMGNTHDIESILAVAGELKYHETVRFLFIGEGSKWRLVENAKSNEGLTNITLLPYQPEEVLPNSMAAGDVGIVAYQPGTESCIVPSKTAYYMAAGLVPLVVSGRPTSLSRMLVEKECGFFVRSGDVEGIKRTILELASNAELLRRYKTKARVTAEHYFSRRNTEQYIAALRQYGLME